MIQILERDANKSKLPLFAGRKEPFQVLLFLSPPFPLDQPPPKRSMRIEDASDRPPHAAIRSEIKTDFRNLKNFGDFVEVKFYYNDDAEVELKPLPGPAFTVGSNDLSAGELAVLEDNEIFLRLIQARLRSDGKRLEDFSLPEIAQRFHMEERTLRRTLQSRKPSPAPL